MQKYVAAALVSLVVAGCATTQPAIERPIPGATAVATAVALCHTTVAELQQRLGMPSREGLIGNDRVVTWVVEWDPLVRYLGVMVDGRGIVVDRYWNLPSEIPWMPTNRCLSPAP